MAPSSPSLPTLNLVLHCKGVRGSHLSLDTTSHISKNWIDTPFLFTSLPPPPCSPVPSRCVYASSTAHPQEDKHGETSGGLSGLECVVNVWRSRGTCPFDSMDHSSDRCSTAGEGPKQRPLKTGAQSRGPVALVQRSTVYLQRVLFTCLNTSNGRMSINSKGASVLSQGPTLRKAARVRK